MGEEKEEEGSEEEGSGLEEYGKENGSDDEEGHAEGQTVVHYEYKGHKEMAGILESHHCDQRQICMALRNRGLCGSGELDCQTSNSCKEGNCRCEVKTSCNGSQQPLLKKSEKFHMRDLRLQGATSIQLAKKDQGRCVELCNSPEIMENPKLCNGTAPSYCRTQLSCQENCACWLNLQCDGGSGGKPSDGKVSLSSGMITDKITLHINRKASSSKETSLEWKSEAEERCSQVAPQFDLGCPSSRAFETHVFCLANLCTCYIQYTTCSSYKNGELKVPENPEDSGEQEIPEEPEKPEGPEETEGPDGPDGPEGPEEPEGPEGPEGPDGAEGPEEPEGPEGPDGAEGPDGPEEPEGGEGEEGKEGEEGPDGQEGPEGTEGPDGPEEPEGEEGEEGPDGQEGPEGPDGPDGPEEPEGPDGPEGEDGLEGEEGPEGPD